MRQHCQLLWARESRVVSFEMKTPSSYLHSNIRENRAILLFENECDVSFHVGTTVTELVFNQMHATFLTDFLINTVTILINFSLCPSVSSYAFPHYLSSILFKPCWTMASLEILQLLIKIPYQLFQEAVKIGVAPFVTAPQNSKYVLLLNIFERVALKHTKHV